MAATIDHHQRRLVILESAFALFAAEGYAGVSYQKIADHCGLSRTIIYQYFANKEEIFTLAIRLATNNLSEMTDRVRMRRDWSPLEKIRRVMHITTKMLDENRIFLTVVLDYVLTQKQRGRDVRRRVRRHTFGMKFLLARLMQEAMAAGEIGTIDPEIAASHLYGLLESCVLNLTVTGVLDARDSRVLIDSYIDSMESSSGSA
ncbi:MAG: TetR/AcrR family transcriptional regulator [Thermoguttaceae bacterium]